MKLFSIKHCKCFKLDISLFLGYILNIQLLIFTLHTQTLKLNFDWSLNIFQMNPVLQHFSLLEVSRFTSTSHFVVFMSYIFSTRVWSRWISTVWPIPTSSCTCCREPARLDFITSVFLFLSVFLQNWKRPSASCLQEDWRTLFNHGLILELCDENVDE